MVSSGIQRLFYVTWTIIKLNLFFVIGSFAGFGLLGIGPAFQATNDLLMTHGIDYEALTFRAFFQAWKANFKRSNCFFALFLASGALLGYNLYLAVQLTGLLWLLVTFLLVFALLLLSIAYLYGVLYESKYEMRLVDLIKLAFISVFLNFGQFLKVLFGIGSILLLTWYFKGLFLFATFSLILIFIGYATKDVRQIIDRKLAQA